MDVAYRPHAVDRMAERRLSTRDVEAVLAAPDGKIRQSRDKWIYHKALNWRKDNSVAVVTVETSGRREIVTVLVNFEVKHGR